MSEFSARNADPPSTRLAAYLFWRILEGQVAFVLVAGIALALGIVFLPMHELIAPPVLWRLLEFTGVTFACALLAHLLTHFARSGNLDSSIDHLRRNVLTAENLARAIPTIVLIKLFVFAFCSFKIAIPDINAFSWDERLSDFDRVIHFGHYPWEVLANVTGYGLFTVAIDRFYYLWFLVAFAPAAFAATTPGNGVFRHRFLLAFVLSWLVVGCLFATLFSSAGPIFYDVLIGGQSGYSGLIANLHVVHSQHELNSAIVSDALWQNYTGATGGVVSGISAMPSMHNAICVLLFLAARHVNRWLALGAALYAFAIFVGSVHLGWHYAVDAYAAAILVAILWKAVGIFVRTSEQPAQTVRANASMTSPRLDSAS